MRDDPPAAVPSLEQAQRRLEQALERLQAKLKVRAAAPTSGAADERDRQRLQAELQEAHTRERQLEQVAAEASAALGRAAAEVRAALQAEV